MTHISVITVVKNGEGTIERTMRSVFAQNYDDYEYIIVDGFSTDRTLEVINSYSGQIDLLISEADSCLYEAMNKGIRNSRGEWIVFMNCGDIFASPDVLFKIFSERIDADFIYSDTIFSDGMYAICDHSKNKIIHQSLFYKKDIHNDVGLYVCSKFLTAADYLFFQVCKHKKWVKTDVVISIFEKGSYSSRIDHFKQKIAIDIMFGNVNKYFGCAIIVFHPIYNFIKKHIVRCKKFLSA